MSESKCHPAAGSFSAVKKSEAEEMDEICSFLNENTTHRPEIAIICGSGLSGLSKCLENQKAFPYNEIPNFPDTTVPGHTGELVFGTLGGTTVVCMRGRFHPYEGHPLSRVTLPVRVFSKLGVKVLLVTNAAGGLNPKYNVGDVMVIQDHFNAPGLAGNHPLVGANKSEFGPRFPPLSDAYDVQLQQIAAQSVCEMSLAHALRHGTYTCVSGPSYETPTEASFLRSVGGDVVGMSTIPEVVVARHCGLRVLGLSLITNNVVLPGPGGNKVPASHAEVLENVQARTKDVESLVRHLIPRLGQALQGEEVPTAEGVALLAQAAAADAPSAAPAPACSCGSVGGLLGVAAVAAGVGALAALLASKSLAR